MRPSFPEIYMRFALDLARRSTCSRSCVGAVITTADFRQIVAVGYNGGAAGQDNNCETVDGVVVPGLCGHLHAEENAIISCSHTGPKTVFVTMLPCKMCAKRLVNLHTAMGPITTVYYAADYRLREGLDVLAAAGIATVHFPVPVN